MRGFRRSDYAILMRRLPRALLALTLVRPALADAPLSGALAEASRAAGRAKAAAKSAALAPEPLRVVLFHTNDIHGQLLPQAADPRRGLPATGGAASLATLLRREKLPWAWFDSGDWFQGTPIGNLTRGRAVIDIFNRLGLSATVLGNHEFDYGAGNLEDILRWAHFPVLSSNHTVRDSAAPRHLRGVQFMDIQAVGGVKLGIVGLTTPSTPEPLAAPTVIEDALAGIAASYVAPLRRLDADAIVVLSHLGVEEHDGRRVEGIDYGEERLARELAGVDLVLGGHLHRQVNSRVRGTDGREVLISQTPGMLRSVNRVELSFDPRTKRLLAAELRSVVLDEASFPPAPDVLGILRAAEDAVAEEMRRPLGRVEAPLPADDSRDSAVGSLVTDAWRDAARSDFAVTGTLGLRDGLPAGELTYEQVYRVLPFDDTLVRFKLFGSDLRALLEDCLSATQVFCQMSGLEIEYDPAADRGSRLKSALVVGAPLDDAREYVGAADHYMVSVARRVAGAREPETLGLARDFIAAYIERNSPLRVPPPGRIRRR